MLAPFVITLMYGVTVDLAHGPVSHIPCTEARRLFIVIPISLHLSPIGVQTSDTLSDVRVERRVSHIAGDQEDSSIVPVRCRTSHQCNKMRMTLQAYIQSRYQLLGMRATRTSALTVFLPRGDYAAAQAQTCR